MKKEKVLPANLEELEDALTYIAQYAVTKQNEDDFAFHKITLSDNKTIVVGIWKDKYEYRITVDGYSIKKVKRSNTEAIEIKLTIFDMIKQNIIRKLLTKDITKCSSIDTDK